MAKILKIIDVSEHQLKIDWEKAAGYIDGAIIRTGYGDDLKYQDDKYAKYNMDECERLGIPYWTYLYSYANSEAHIKSEIEHEKRMTKGRKTLGHFLDLERRDYTGTWRAAAEAWLKAFPGGGCYSWQWAFEQQLKGLDCRRWICAYGTNNGKPQYNKKPTITCDGWQYTSRGSIPGIIGNVDVNEWYVDFGGTKAVSTSKAVTGKRVVYKKEVAMLIFTELVTNSAHGYTMDMDKRWGTGTRILNILGHEYKIAGGDRDCSSGIISAFEAAGISCGGATYTGNMRSCMVKTGNFEVKPMSYIAQSADIYLNERSHTAMCLSAEPDILGQFSINEKGTGYGGKTGDQLQKGEYDSTYGRGESHIREYYDYPWDMILRCVNNEVAFVIDEATETAEKTGGDKVEIKMPEKTDTDLAVEVLFNVYGSGEKRKTNLGKRYASVQSEVDALWKSPAARTTAEKAYFKKFGCDALFKVGSQGEPVTAEREKTASAEYKICLTTKLKPNDVKKGMTVVIEPEDYTLSEIVALKSTGCRLLAYLNLGSVEDTRSYFKDLKPYLKDKLPDWPHEWYLDLTQKKVQDWIVAQGKVILARSVDGLWADNVDAYEEYPSSAAYRGITSILQALYPLGYIMINGGIEYMTKAMRDGIRVAHGVTQEEVFSRITNYSGKGEFGTQTSGQSREYQKYIEEVLSNGMDACLLEYSEDEAVIKQIITYCEKSGAGYYISADKDL